MDYYPVTGMFPKIVVPPNHPFLIGFSIITIHFGVPLFLETPIYRDYFMPALIRIAMNQPTVQWVPN